MIEGSIVALVTPFLEDGQLDVKSLKNLIHFHIERGSDALVLCGTTGEAPTLSEEEMLSIFEIAAKEAKGKIPLIAGTGTHNTSKSVYLTREAKKRKMDACLVVFPYYNRPTFEGCVKHFELISKENLPMIIYHHPTRTGIKMSPSQLAEISQIDAVFAIKEASGDIDHINKLLQITSKAVFSGDDAITLPLIEAGARGVISIVANVIPKEWKEFVDACLQGKIQIAQHLYQKYVALCKSLVVEVNPQGVKYALSLLQKCRATLRLPLIEPQAATKAKIYEALEQLDFCSHAFCSQEAVAQSVDV